MVTKKEKRKKMLDTSGIIFPNLFTTGNLFCGFYSIVYSLKGEYRTAAYLILIASLFDMVDGRVARLMKSVSEFGKEYDSLADMVSFGVAPALMIYLANLMFVPKLGWLLAFMFVACGALRLARFNVIYKATDPAYFIGLPIPIAAVTLASSLLFFREIGIDTIDTYAFIILIPILSFLMVSAVNYRSYKKSPDSIKKDFFSKMFILILLLILVAINPDLILFILSGVYVFLGTIGDIYNRIKLLFKKKD